jgi:hypothetical protein
VLLLAGVNLVAHWEKKYKHDANQKQHLPSSRENLRTKKKPGLALDRFFTERLHSQQQQHQQRCSALVAAKGYRQVAVPA